jgi:hypothetical protein
MPGDLDFQLLSTVASAAMQKPPTIASATTIAPTSFVSFISGTAAIVNITPPVPNWHMLVFIPTGAYTMTAAGNIGLLMAAATVSQPVILIYSPTTGKYYAGKLSSA